MFKENNIDTKENKEKPPFLWHGSTASNIEEFIPTRLSTPSNVPKETVPERVYASDLPAFSAAHSFPWATFEGFDLGVGADNSVVLNVPHELQERLNQKVFMYKLPSGEFEITLEETTGHTYHATKGIVPVEKIEFNSVTEAINHFGGVVNII